MAYVVPEGVPGLQQGNYVSEAAARAVGSNGITNPAPVAGGTPPALSTADQIMNSFKSLWAETDDERAQVKSAREGLAGYAMPDFAKTYADFLAASGASGLSSQISSLRNEANRLGGIYRDVPDTILKGAQDEGIIKKMLDLQSANAREPLTRSINDLLQSVSVLSDEYQRAQSNAQYQTGLYKDAEQQRYNSLVNQYGFAQDDLSAEQTRINSLFPTIAGQYQQEAQNQFTAGQNALGREMDARTLAETQRQFNESNNPTPGTLAYTKMLAEIEATNRSGRGGGGGSDTGEPTVAQLRAADELVFAYGLNPTKLTPEQQTAFSTAITYYPGDRAKQDEYLKKVGIMPASIRQGKSKTPTWSWVKSTWTRPTVEKSPIGRFFKNFFSN